MQTRAAALDALEAALIATFTSPATFSRDPEGNVDASHGGVVIMTFGEPGQAEEILSPLSYAWEHQVNFEITASGQGRRATVEALIAKFEPALGTDRTLGGTVDDARVVLPVEQHDYEVVGAENELSAVLFVQLSYTTASGAN